MHIMTTFSASHCPPWRWVDQCTVNYLFCLYFCDEVLCTLFTFFRRLSSSLSPCLSQRFGRCTLQPSSGGRNVERNPLWVAEVFEFVLSCSFELRRVFWSEFSDRFSLNVQGNILCLIFQERFLSVHVPFIFIL